MIKAILAALIMFVAIPAFAEEPVEEVVPMGKSVMMEMVVEMDAARNMCNMAMNDLVNMVIDTSTGTPLPKPDIDNSLSKIVNQTKVLTWCAKVWNKATAMQVHISMNGFDKNMP